MEPGWTSQISLSWTCRPCDSGHRGKARSSVLWWPMGKQSAPTSWWKDRSFGWPFVAGHRDQTKNDRQISSLGSRDVSCFSCWHGFSSGGMGTFWRCWRRIWRLFCLCDSSHCGQVPAFPFLYQHQSSFSGAGTFWNRFSCDSGHHEKMKI